MRRRRVLACLLAVLSLAATEEPAADPVLVVTCRDTAALTEALARHPAASAWSQVSAKGLRVRLAKPRPWLEPATATALLGDLAHARLELASADPRRGWSAAAEPRDPEACWSMLTTLAGAGGDQLALGTWRWRRDGARIVGGDVEAPEVHAARADGPLLGIRARPGDLLQRAGVVGGREAMAVLALETIALELAADGAHERIVAPGFAPPLRPIAAQAADRAPDDAFVIVACGIDGPRLGELIARLGSGSSDVGDLVALWNQRCAARCGTLAEVARALDGPAMISLSSTPLVPALTIALPASPEVEALVDRLAPMIGFDAVAARTGTAPIARASGTKSTLLPGVRRSHGWWYISSDLGVLDRLPGPAPAAPAADPGPAPALTVRVALDQLGAYANTLATLASTRGRPSPGGDWPILVARALVGSAREASCALTIDATGTTVEGRGASAALAVPVMSLLVARNLLLHEARVALRGDPRTQMDAVARAFADWRKQNGRWPDAEQGARLLPEHALPSMRPTYRYVAPAANAPADQPVLVSTPVAHDGRSVLALRVDGRVEELTPAPVADAYWLVSGSATAGAPRSWTSAREIRRAALLGDRAPIELAEHNLRFLPPARPWQAADAKLVNPAFKVLWARAMPEIYVGVIPELAEPDDGMMARAFETMRVQLASVSKSLEVIEEGPATLLGLPALRRRSRVTIEAMDLVYDQIVTARNGHVVQAVAWAGTRQVGADRLSATLDEFVARLEPIDPGPLLAGPAVAADLLLRDGAAKLSLAGKAWAAHPRPGQVVEGAQAFLSHPDGTCALTATVRTGGIEPDIEGMAQALFGLLNIGYPDPGHVAVRPIDGDAPGIETDFERVVEDVRYRYVLRTVRRGGHAHLVAAWAPADADSASARSLVDAFAAGDAPAGGSDAAVMQDARFANELCIHAYRAGTFPEALAWGRRAVELAPTDAAIVGNCLACWERTARWAEALAWFDAHAAPLAGAATIAAYRPRLLAETGDHEGAIAGWRRLFARGSDDADAFSAYVELLWRLGRREDALAAFADCRPVGQTAAARMLQADLHGRAGEHERAVEVLERLAAERGRERATLVALADARCSAGRYSDALAGLEAMIAAGDRSTEVWHLRGVAECGLKWYRKAKASFERALAVNPAAGGSREYLEHVNGMLGKGDSADIAAVIEPVPDPAYALPAKAAAGRGGGYVRRCVAMRYTRGRSLRHTTRAEIAVTDREAVDAFGTLVFSYHPAHESLHVSRLVTKAADGSRLGEGRLEDYYILDVPGSTTGEKLVHLPVPGIRPGCTVECEVTTEELSRAERMPFREHGLHASRPIGLSSVLLIGDIDGIDAVATGGATLERDASRIAAVARDLPATRFQMLSPDLRTWLPTVRFVGTGTTWEAEGRSYLADIEPYLRPDAEVAAVAAALPGAGRERAVAAVETVQTRVSYNAIGFGTRARTPIAPREALSRGHGDCKDHAVLLHRLLAEIGIPSCLVLASTAGGLDPAAPDLDQFNHMLVAVLDGPEPWFVDPTAKRLSPALAVPPGLGGETVLLLDPSGPRLALVPRSPEGEASVRIARELAIAADGGVAVRERVVLSGHLAAWLRDLLAASEPHEHVQRLQQAIGITGMVLEEAEVAGIDDPRQDVAVSLRYRAPPLIRADGRLAGRVPCPWERMVLSPERDSRRTAPLRIRFPMRFETRARWTAAEGLRIQARPPAEAVQAPGFEYRERLDGEGLVAEFRHLPGEHPPAAHAAYVEAHERALDLLGVELVVAKP